MSKTNCCNCGAPLNIFSPKCKYCGTKNINITDIDLASNEAANFIFKLPRNIVGIDKGEVYMSMLAIPELSTMEMTANTTNIYGGFGSTALVSYDTHELQFGLNLRAVSRPQNNSLCELTVRKDY